MSHYTVGALVPPAIYQGDGDGTRLERYLEELLEPFNENAQVEEYQRECWCVGTKASEEASEYIEAKHGPIEPLRKRYWESLDGQGQPTLDWEELVKDRMADREAFLAQHPDRESPKPDCSGCHGTGTYASTYNPDSKWDWWVIGGRWEGMINGRNICVVRDLPEDFSTFALLAPGNDEHPQPFWFEKGQMGWFGMVSNEKNKDDWHAQRCEILSAFPDHLLVVLDLHI